MFGKKLMLTSAVIAVTVLLGCGKQQTTADRPVSGEAAVVSGDALADTAAQEHHAAPVDDSSPDTAGLASADTDEDTASADTVPVGTAEYTPPAPGSQFNPNINYGSFTDPRDGKTYRTVKIGGDTWMAENLNFQTEGSSCYDNDESNCAVYGRLYLGMSACPAGWRVPGFGSWMDLAEAVGGEVAMFTGSIVSWRAASEKLRSTVGWRDSIGGGTDDFGFSALPGGSGYCPNSKYDEHCEYSNIGSGTAWHSDTDDDGEGYRWAAAIDNGFRHNSVGRGGNLLYVRCVQR